MKPEIQDPKVVSITPLKDMFRELSEWTDRIAKRAFEIFEGNGFLMGHDLDNWLAAERELLKPVAIEVKDNKEEFTVTAEVPGFNAEDLEIQVLDSRLILKGKHEDIEKREKEGEVIYSERKARELYRMIDLPTPVLEDKAVAKLRNGVLELKLPKAQKTVPIKVMAA